MDEQPEHFCPGCGAKRKAFLRYPWHFCNDCRALACDKDGRRIECFNTSIGGGFAWRYVDEPEEAMRECYGVIAVIRGRPVYLHEARFGGVVAEPMMESARVDRRGVWRIDGRFPVEPEGR
ncbi:hypothetical protein [Vannielia litorea]|uniref:hypothetical protein n=1 Tax=Vannielia litorea TaxID=1217970 RepID=UPI001C93B1CE|nr:hypothetical protein [Vannielia litorea]MBY6049893.1 hypothetical protein [Vannielia litorea]MBY6077307.1 hypothetical protein [Vannielia litorea]